MDIEVSEEPKKEKKGKKKKEKEREKENTNGTKIKEENFTIDNIYLEGKENEETDGHAIDEKNKNINKNNKSFNKGNEGEEVVVEERLSKIKIDETDKNDPKLVVLNYLIAVKNFYFIFKEKLKKFYIRKFY